MSRTRLKFNADEKRVASVLTGVYTTRMFGLFVVLPVLAPVAAELESATPILIGLALGIYGLPQAVLQIPFGLWSDRIGRKPVIVGGLLIFAVGGFVAAFIDNIYGLIAGRALQGSGAIAAVIMAFVADTTRAALRSKMMAFIGMGIGAAFMAGLIAGPPLEAAVGLKGVFVISSVFALLAALIVQLTLPAGKPAPGTRVTISKPAIVQTLRNKELLRLDAGIFVLHLIFVANFLVLPSLLESQLQLDVSGHWKFYAPLLVLSFLLVFPLFAMAERKHKLKELLVLMIGILGFGQLALAWMDMPGSVELIVVMLLFFAAFNYLEANLPSLASRVCDPSVKGFALGIFSQSQFLGGFVGGAAAGVVLHWWGPQAVYMLTAATAGIWLLLSLSTSRLEVPAG